MDTIHAACMDETHGTYVGDECFDIHAMMMPIMVLIKILTMILMIPMMTLVMILMTVVVETFIQSRLKDQGPCPSTDEHPRRDTGLI